MDVPLIEFRNVTKRFGERTILDEVNFQIYDGHVTTIIGKSGTGKSVLLKHIIGLLSPTEGTILFRGKPLREMHRDEFDDFRSQFSYCFQNNALFDSLTVFGNIAMPLQHTTKMGKKDIEKKVQEKMEQLDVAEIADKYPSELSGGMQKRVALARALVTDPKIILFDEPTTGQDPIRKNAILSMIAQNQKRFGFTTLMISHEIPDVFFISNRILILYDGKIIFQGTHHELDQLEHPMVDEFIRSLRGFEEELKGGPSESFESFLSENSPKSSPTDALTVALFAIDDLSELSEKLGQRRTDTILHSLDEYINTYFADVGISNRMATNEIATVLTCTDTSTAYRLLEGFAQQLEEHGLDGIHTEKAGNDISGKTCDFSVRVGVVAGIPGEEIQITANKARSRQKEIVRFHC